MTKICKKSLALLLALAVCVSAMVCGVIVSAETPTPTITLVADKEAPVPGDTVKITAQVADFSAVFGADIEITLPAGLAVTEDKTVAIGPDDEIYYNAEKNTLTYVGLGSGLEMADGVVVSYNPVGGSAAGDLFAFTFVVPQDATEGTKYGFEFSTTAAENNPATDKAVRYCDAEENEIVPTTTGVTVAVASAVVPDPDPVLTTSINRVSGTTKYSLNVYFNYDFQNGTVAEYGVLFYRAASYTDGMAVSVENADLVASLGTNSASAAVFSGFNLLAITEKFVFVPYVKDTADAYYYGSVEKVSYVDYLLDRLANGSATVKQKAQAILDSYYLVYGVVAYDGQPEPSIPDFESAGTYAAVTPLSTTDNGEFATTVAVTGTTKFALNIAADFSAYSGTAAQYGILVKRAAGYDEGVPVTVENCDINLPLTNATQKATISGFSHLVISERFVLVPYVIDDESVYHYGSTSRVSYTDYLVSKLNGVSTAAQKTTAKKALALLDTYSLLFGTSLYTVS